MASGSFTKTIRTDHEYMKVWWSSSQNGSENKSTVSVYAKIYRPTKLTSSANKTIITTIDGNSKKDTVSGWGGKGWTAAFGSHSVVVNHNADGTKSVKIKVTAHLGLNLGSKHYDDVTAEATVKLDTLSVKSTIDWASASVNSGTAKIGDMLSVNLKRSNSTVRHQIVGQIGAYSFDILKKSEDNGSQNTITIDTSNLLQYMSNSSETLTVTCITYPNSSSSTSLGSATISSKISLDPSNPTHLPSIISCNTSYIPVGHNFSASAIQGKSRVKLSIVSGGASGSNIDAYYLRSITDTGIASDVVKYANTNEASDVFEIITDIVPTTASEMNYEIYAIDKRGMKSNVYTVNIPVIAYYTPKQTGINIYRCNSNGSNNSSGTYISVNINFDYAKVSNTNKISITIESKSTLENYTTLETLNNVTSNSVSKIYSGFSTDTSYSFRITLSDEYGSVVTFIPEELSTETILIDLSPTDGVAIGKVAERSNAFEVEFESWFNKPVHANVVALTSDARMKTIISRDIDLLKSAWRDIGITLFRYNGSSKQYVGVIAQELMDVFEKYNLDWRDYGIFHKDTDGYFSVDYNSIFAITTYMAQIAFDKLDELEEKVNYIYDNVLTK